MDFDAAAGQPALGRQWWRGVGDVIGGVVSLAGVAVAERYESQKRRDWNTFGQYLRNHRPPLSLARCSGAHVLEFLRYLDQFGKTKAWGSLDALVGRLRAAYEENGGRPENNPFGARAVRLYLREVREHQTRARGVSYDKKKRRKPPQQHHPAAAHDVHSHDGNGHHYHPHMPPPPPGAARELAG
ncbi:hypothetical protein ACQ4PT_025619 [Festuca glaucescens]